jgi:hypothetical protein
MLHQEMLVVLHVATIFLGHLKVIVEAVEAAEPTQELLILDQLLVELVEQTLETVEVETLTMVQAQPLTLAVAVVVEVLGKAQQQLAAMAEVVL